MTRFYHTKNVSRRIESGGFVFKFEAYELFASSWYGIYQTDDLEQQEALQALVDDRRSGVTEIDEEEYAACLKKKPTAKPLFQVSVAFSPPPKSIDGRGGAVVVERPRSEVVQAEMEAAPAAAPTKTVEEVLNVGKLAAPPEVEIPTKSKRSKKG